MSLLLLLTAPRTRDVGQAIETDLAQTIAPVRHGVRTIGQALDTQTARPVTIVEPTTLPPGAARRTRHATYTLEVSWEATAQGAFVIGTSTIGGTDTLALSPFDVSFTGDHDDLSSRFRGARFKRGRNDDRTFVLAGEGQAIVRDLDGKLNPENPTSPLHGLLEGRYQPARLRGYLPDGTMFPLFYGFVEKIEWRPYRRDPGAGEAVLTLRDLLLWLNEARPAIAATGPTTTGAAIGRILDAVGWLDPTARLLDTGDPIPDFQADGETTALELIGQLLDAERGVFYIDGAGVAVYEDRLARTIRAPEATIVDQMRSAVPAVDHSRMQNRILVKRTQTGYVAEAIDITSRTLIGNRDLPQIETSYLISDSQADSLASYVLSLLGSPVEPLRDFQIDNRTDELLLQCMARELGDVVTLVAAAASLAGPDYLIEQLEHIISPDRGSHVVTWLLSQHDTITPFTIGVSTLVGDGDPGHTLVY